jgi:hypothetical protein
MCRNDCCAAACSLLGYRFCYQQPQMSQQCLQAKFPPLCKFKGTDSGLSKSRPPADRPLDHSQKLVDKVPLNASPNSEPNFDQVLTNLHEKLRL